VRDYLLSAGIESSRIDMAANGVDLNTFAVERNEIDPGRPPHIIFVGRLIENKGPGLFLDSLAQLASEDFKFTADFIGDGPLRKRLMGKTARVGLAQRVTFKGHLNDVASELAKADIFVRPSLTEGLPLAVLEAMAARVCVVASDIPGNRDLVRHEANGLLVTPHDSKSLTAALRRLLHSPAEARWLAEAGYETARSYTWENAARRTGESLLSAALLTPSRQQRAA
jgi:glycosyltransferase involved in cell wall biosynthesis